MYRGELIQIREENENNYIIRHREQGTFFIANKTQKIILELLDKGVTNEDVSKYLQNEFNLTSNIANWYVNASLYNLLSMQSGSNLKFDFKAPIRVGWRLTENCNLRCKHCYLSCGEKKQFNNISLEDCKKIIDKLDEGGIFEILLTGGEIFTRPDLKEIVEYIAKKNIDISVYTNATLFEKNWDWIIKSPIRRFNISLDGIEDDHDYLRGNGNFEKTISSIRKLISNNKMVIINCVINKRNVRNVPKIYEFLKKEKVGIQFSLITPMGRASLNDELIPNYQDFNSSMNELQLMYKQSKDNNITYNYYKKEIISINNGNKTTSKDNWKCNAGTTKFDIDVNGDVLICPFRQNTKIGNILESSVSELWNSIERDNFNAFSKKYVGRLCKPVSETIANDPIAKIRLKELIEE